MSIVLGYTRASDDEEIVIGTYDTVGAAENAIEAQTITDVSTYWLASYINTETNQPDIFAYIDV